MDEGDGELRATEHKKRHERKEEIMRSERWFVCTLETKTLEGKCDEVEKLVRKKKTNAWGQERNTGSKTTSRGITS